MLDGELQNITRQQFIIEALQPRVLLSATLAEDVTDDTVMTCVMIDLLPAGEFVESESPQEPVGDSADEPAAGEEVLMYNTMLASETDVPENQIEYTTLETQVDVPAGDEGEVVYYTMVGEENPENLEDVPVDGGVTDVPEEWVYMTGVGEGPNVFHPLNDNPEILQSSTGSTVDSPNLQAPPPAQSAGFAKLQAQPAVARSVLSLDSQDLLASPNDVLV